MTNSTNDQSATTPMEMGPRAVKSRLVAARLLESAVGVFGEMGFEKARVSDVARRCGVSSGAVFSRWPTKEDLFCAAVESVSPNRFAFSVAHSSASASDKLAALGEFLLAHEDVSHRALMLEARSIARRNAELRGRLKDIFGDETEALTQIIEEGKAAGAIEEGIDSSAIVLFRQALDLGTLLAMTTNPDDSAQMTKTQWNELVGRVIDAMRPS